jgi:hypothetical protein
LSNAAATLACGIELTEILHNKAPPRKSQQKRICSNGIFRKLGVKTPEYDELSQKVLKGLLQNNRLWASDSGSITPYRLEFYLRSRGVTSEVVEMVLSFGKDSWSKLPDVDKKLVCIAEMAISRAQTAAAEEAEKAKTAARKAKEASDALVKRGEQILLKNKAASEAPIDAENAEMESQGGGPNDDARSMVSAGAESMRSMVTNESVRSVVSGYTDSARSMVSEDMLEAVKTFAQLRTPVDEVSMREALDLQKLRVFKMKTTAHRKKKLKGDLSYSLAGVVSLAFGLIPKAPQRGLD